jgi:hypothetical protein
MADRPNKAVAGSASSASAALTQSVRHLLRPLARLLLANGVTYPALAALLKEIYFDVARQELAPGEKRQTNSQISLVTGIHRKDVRRMLEDGAAPEALHKETSLASEVFTRWISDPRFLNSRRQPLALARLASVGGERSFEFLAAGISKDVRARALLDELLRLGLVAVDGSDRVVLNRRAFVPAQGSEELAFYFGQNAHDHLAAAMHNLLGHEPMFLEQGIFGDQLSQLSVDELAELVRKEWRRMVREIVPRAAKLDERDAKRGTTDMRMRFGIYFYAEKNKPRGQVAMKPQRKKNTIPDKAQTAPPQTRRRKGKT